jgi:hypothetical protein
MVRMVTGVLVLMLLGVAGPARANMLVNGGFETGDFTGWSQSGNTGFTFVSPNDPNSGKYSAWLGPVGSLGYLSQTVATTPGNSYTLDFFLASDGRTPNEFQVLFGGTTVFDQTNIPSQGYTDYQFTVAATSSSTTLQFGFRNDQGFLMLDDVSLTPSSSVAGAPEPAGLTLLALGCLGLAARARRRRVVPALA